MCVCILFDCRRFCIIYRFVLILNNVYGKVREYNVMSAEQIKNGFVLAAIAVQTNKNAKFAFLLVQTFLDANTACDFRKKSQAKVQGFAR